MIKPQELRIGNLFHSTKRIKGIKMPFGIAKVLTLGLFGLEWLPPDQIPAQVEVWNKSEYSEIEPIPLTPEWLEKFGFIRNKPSYVSSKPYFSITLLKGMTDSLSIRVSGEHFEDTFYWSTIKYVHQLQNLYFALTGEELIAVSQEQIQPPKTEAQEP